MAMMFSFEDRDRVRHQVMDLASADSRVVAGAILGSLAHGEGDRWSDLDLSFAVADGIPVSEVLEDFSGTLVGNLDAVPLFDLPSGPIIYRVFLLPDCLELDLSFAPTSEFGPEGATFRLLFGEAVVRADSPPTAAQELFGYAVHHTLHARAAIERGRYWQAEHWISAVRDYGLHLACRRQGLDGWYGRDFDKLPAEVRVSFQDALVRSLERDELDRALAGAVSGLLRVSADVREMARRVEGPLRRLASRQD
jgi:hypothetical protein